METIAACPVCYMAYGLAEPHGAYNALGLDWLKAYGICERAAKAHGGVVAPPLCWHISDMPQFPWTASMGVRQPLTSAVSADLFLKTVLYQLRAFDARGFQAAILITGHYGGIERDIRLACEYYARRAGSPMRIAAFADWELIVHDAYGVDYKGDHGGILETSQLMALRPDLVHLERTDETSPTGPWIGTRFPLEDGSSPSRELGEEIVASQINRLADVQRELLAGYSPVEGRQAPSLNDVESLAVRFERATRKYWVCSQTLDEFWGVGPPPFPGWDALGE